jgi:hypothetical protein
MLNTFSFVGVRNYSDLNSVNNAPPVGMVFRQKKLVCCSIRGRVALETDR